MSWTVSNSQTGKTGATYAYAFTTATSAALTSVTMTVPSGTGGTPGVGTVYGLGAGTASLVGTTLTYTITTPVTVPANIPIYVSFTGLTNNTPVFSLAVDPSQLDNGANQQVVLTVQTNASAGYALAVSDTGLSRNSPAFTIPAVSSGPTSGVATFPAKGWGFSASLTTGGTDGATLASGLSGGKLSSSSIPHGWRCRPLCSSALASSLSAVDAATVPPTGRRRDRKGRTRAAAILQPQSGPRRDPGTASLLSCAYFP